MKGKRLMDILKTLAEEFSLKDYQVTNTVNLIDEGNTIPFIARYRKELTGSIDDQVLRNLNDRLNYLRNLLERKEQVKTQINEQGKLTDEIENALAAANTLTEVEDIYRPFRPKRRTRATIARDRGLEPLSLIIFAQETKEDISVLALNYVNAENGVETSDDAIAGALDIIAETISDDANYRSYIRKATFESGFVVAKAKDENASSVYDMYKDFTEPVKKIAQHRVLAINRGEKEDVLSVKIEAPVEEILSRLNTLIVKNNVSTSKYMSMAVEDAYHRLIAPSIEREIRNDLTEKAEEGAMKVFSENLRQLLLAPPVKDKVVLALDPGFRTGCKVAVIDGTGKTLETGVIYATPPASKIEESKKKLIPMIEKHSVEIIAIGNGTASRETEQFVVDMLKEIDRKIYYIIVNEAGASVYSASKLGAEEFPDFDVALRSAVSIGRRLQDPLAELVKIDPKSIGVGQYQHDMNQKRLGETLGGVVEACVNNKLGSKAFEQCAGFLRVPGGDNWLDNTGVHPESYKAAKSLLEKLKLRYEDIGAGFWKKYGSDVNSLAKELDIGAPTLSDIIKELEKPGRDVRDEMPPPILKSDLITMEQLVPGMILKGTVRNVIDFGVFVDIGVHQDGLVHISQISDKYIKHPLDAVSVGEVVDVKVLSVDLNKKRISLSMKLNA
ncbi:30s ribosomal protein s1 [Holotrichia oblita]|nr:30s ribosomal protein s1 [Holotrichia oblita]